VSQNQPESSSGLGLKIGGVIALALVGILYFAFARSDTPMPEAPKPPADLPQAEAQPHDTLQEKPMQERPGNMNIGGTTEGEEIEKSARLAATPIQRPAAQPPGIAALPRRDRPAAPAETGADPAANDDADPEDLPTLRQMALTDPDPERRLTAVTLLGVSENSEAIPILAQALSDQEEDVRMEAVLALADFTDEAPVQALEIALSDPSPDVRYEALDVLSDIETPEAYQAIKGALDDPDDDVRELAELLSELYADEEYAQ
jgi:hypothetical protein